jgi:hypothetical protein
MPYGLMEVYSFVPFTNTPGGKKYVLWQVKLLCFALDFVCKNKSAERDYLPNYGSTLFELLMPTNPFQ